MNLFLKNMFKHNEVKQINDISEYLNLKLNCNKLKKIKKKYVNAFEINDDLIYFYPINDGKATCPFEFYKDGKLIIGNNHEFSEISNLDDILLEMVRVFSKAIDYNIVLNPYSFMLELTDDNRKAKLVITEETIKNPKLSMDKLEEACKYYINIFLDHFIGWNFGLSVNRSEELRSELEELNEKVIDMGIREDAGPGLDVYGVVEKEINGLQHYRLPTSKEKIKKLGNR